MDDFTGFTLTIKLTNAEAAESPDLATADYLADVAARVLDGFSQGSIRDGNGNEIGEFHFTRDS